MTAVGDTLPELRIEATPTFVVSSAIENRREWAARRNQPESPLADPRGPRRRARALRDMARLDPDLVAADIDRLRLLLGEQPTLW